jgi:hypothetical protein
MYRRLHDRLGTAGIVIAVIALVAALGGTALAASAALSGKQKKEVEKIAKKYAGKPGAAGPAGTNGTNGTNGKDGAPGAPGKDGTNGNSVVVLNEAPANCTAGGFTYEVQGSGEENEVCNGENGQTGFTETLPPGKTETGGWAYFAPAGNPAVPYLSFNIPLAAPLDGAHVHYAKLSIQQEKFGSGALEFCEGKTGTELTSCEAEGRAIRTACPGSKAEPEAEEGNLCVYESGSNGMLIEIFPASSTAGSGAGAARSGAVLFFVPPGAGAISGFGTWAVTAA